MRLDISQKISEPFSNFQNPHLISDGNFGKTTMTTTKCRCRPTFQVFATLVIGYRKANILKILKNLKICEANFFYRYFQHFLRDFYEVKSQIRIMNSNKYIKRNLN